MLSSSIEGNVQPFGSDVTLTCNASLTSTPDVEVPLNVTFELLRMDPAGSLLPTTTPSVSGSTYTSTATISSFGRNDSGNYTCRVTISSINTHLTSSNNTSNSLRVTTGMMTQILCLYSVHNIIIPLFRCLSCTEKCILYKYQQY